MFFIGVKIKFQGKSRVFWRESNALFVENQVYFKNQIILVRDEGEYKINYLFYYYCIFL